LTQLSLLALNSFNRWLINMRTNNILTSQDDLTITIMIIASL
jgi:hypothetical protein